MTTQSSEQQWLASHQLPLEWEQWNHPIFQQYQRKIDEENEFTENPLVDVEEGAGQCDKCKSQQLLVQEKQLRKSDEGNTLFYTCVKCGHRWVHNG